MPAMLRRNVLIFHAGALGDFVLTWPLVMALGRLHPQSRIIVVTHASKGSLAELALHVESHDIEQGWHGLFTSDGDLPERPARLLEGAHAIYTFMAGENALRERAPDAQLVSLKPTPPSDYGKHASQHLIEQLGSAPASKSAVEQMLRSINLRGIGTGRSHDGDIVVHPGSGSREKCWPVERFVKLIEKLKRKKREVRVLIGEVEDERFTEAQIASLEKAAGAAVRRPATYVELFNELRTASLFIGNDSGPAHLAAVSGLPTVALFGATDPAIWKPLGPRVRVLHRPALDAISVDDVLGEVKSYEGGA
ncbi:MAG TPA: glycosyltransferase family 9 protein [Tepidisphaeraceae bacterium]|nr:glycosyltransferase family 9 protein [Tepidisphaeraceae bacterium]